jgi:hypothetical protein
MTRPMVRIEYSYGDNNGYPENSENIHVGWNAFYNHTVIQLAEGVKKAKEKLEEEESTQALDAYVRKMKEKTRI